MAFPKSLSLFFAFVMAALCLTHAYTIDVGGSKGWTLNPPEDYDLWAARMRFSINDTLQFICNKKTDSVLVVSRDDYDKCNSNKPIIKMKGEDTRFKFEESGPFYFITGNKTNCDKGQKMHLIVMAVRRNEQPTASASPAPAAPISVSPSPRGAAGMSPPTGRTTKSLNSPPPADPSSATPALHAPSTVSFVMICLALVGFIGSA